MPLSKAERTTQYIIETAAPVFNKKGYVGTSMKDLTEATHLTKGAIYGNFENKEALALAAFNYSLKNIMQPLNTRVNAEKSAIEKLKALTRFYRGYYRSHMHEMGGCAILNVSVDTHFQNPKLFERVRDVIRKLRLGIENMIEQGKREGSLRADLDTEGYASKIYGMIQGSVFLTMTLDEEKYINDMMDHVDNMIDTEMRN